MTPLYSQIDTSSLVFWLVFPSCRLAWKSCPLICLDPKPSL